LADGNDLTIDSLQIEIASSSADAEQSIDRLCASLMGLNTPLKKIGSNVGNLRKMITTLSTLQNFKMPDLSQTVGQLERISKIDFSKLQGKALDFNIKVSGASKMERMKYAIMDVEAVADQEAKKIAADFEKAFNLDKSATKRIQADIKTMFNEIAKDENGGGFELNDIIKTVNEAGSVTKNTFEQYMHGMSDDLIHEYAEFMKYVTNHPINSKDILNAQGSGKGGKGAKSIKENWFQGGFGNLVSKNGEHLDEGLFDYLLKEYPNVASGADEAASHVEKLLKMLENAKRALNEPASTKDAQVFKSAFINDSFVNVIERVNEIKNKSMKESATKIPLDLVIDEQRIEKQITSAIKKAVAKAKEVDYGKINLNLAVNTSGLRQDINDSLGKIDPSKMTDVSNALKNMTRAYSVIAKTDIKGSGFTGFANGLKRMIDASSGFDANSFEAMANSTKALANDVAGINVKTGGVAALVNGISRLINASKTFNPSTFDVISQSVRKLCNDLRDAGNGAEAASSFARSLGTLINSINKFDSGSNNFADITSELVNMFTSLANIPISDNLAKATEGLGNLAATCGKTSASVQDVYKSFASNNSSISFFADLFSNASATIKGLQQDFAAIHPSAKIFGELFRKIGESFKTFWQLTKKVASGLKLLGTEIVKLGKNLGKFLGAEVNLAVSGLQKLGKEVSGLKEKVPSVDTLHLSLKNLLATVIGFRGITGVFNWAKEALTLGGDITEIDHIIESVFGENMTGYIEEWSRNAINNFGIAQGAAKQYAGTLNAMFKASNIASDKSSVMAIKMVELAGDLSAFYNIDTADAYQKIQAGLAGMVRPLRSLGLDLSVASLKEYALAQGITKSYTEMTQAEKVMLRYQYLLDHTAVQTGDFKATSESLANQIRILRANLQAITTEIGVGFAAAIRHVVIILNKLLEKVLIVSKAFSTFMQTLFGKYKGGSKGFTFDDYGMDDAEDNLGNMSDSASDVADGLSDADDATKKLKKDLSVLPFDELNQLSKDLEQSTTKNKNKSPSGGTYEPNISDMDDLMDGAFDLDFDGLESPLGKLEEYISEWAKRIKEQFDKKNWDGLGREVAKGINDFVDYLLGIFDPQEAKKKIGEWIDAFTTSFNGFVDELDFEDIGRLIGEGLDVVFSSINRLVDGIDWQRLGEQLASGANGLVESIPWEELGKLLTNKFNILWNIAEGFATKFNWSGLGEGLARGANALVEKIDFKSLVNAISAGLNGIADAVNRFATNFKWSQLGQKLAKNANQLINQIDIDKIGTALGNILNGLFTVAYNFVSNFNWKELGSMFANGINSLIATVNFDFIASTVYTGLNGVIDSIRSFFADLDVVTAGNKIGKAFADMINGVHWKDLGTGLAEIWNKAWSFLNEFISNLGTTDVRVEGLYSFNNISQSDVDKALKKGTGIGQAIHDALRGAIENVKIDDMVDSINKLVQKIAQDISIAFGDTTLWYKIGHTIGEGISGILGNKDTVEEATNAINAIADALYLLFAGAFDALSSHSQEIGGNIRTFLTGLPWDAIFGAMTTILVAKIAAKVPIIIAGWAIKQALIKSIKGVLTEVATDGTVANAGGGVFKGIINGAETLKEKLATVLPKAIATLKNSFKGLIEILGAEGVSGSVLGGLLLAGKAISELQDKMAGGNGMLTPEGKVVDDFITQLQQMGSISEDVKNKLFELKEAWEEGTITQAEFAEQFKTTLEEAGVSAETASTQVKKIASTGYESKEAVDFLSTSIQGLSSNVDNSQSAYDTLGITGEEAFDKIKSALGLLDASLGDNYGTLTNDFVNAYQESSNSATEALSSVTTKWEGISEYPARIKAAIDESLGEGAFDTLISATDSAGASFDSTASKAENYGNKVKSAGDLVATATEHSKAYNETTSQSPSLIETLLPIIGGLASKFLASFGQKEQYYSTMETNVGETGKAVDEKGGVLTNAIQTLASKALATFRINIPKFKSSSEEIPTGIGTGIQAKQQEPINMVQQMSELMQEKFRIHNGINSPSSVYSGMSENIPLGVAQGIANKQPDALVAVVNLVTAMKEKFDAHLKIIGNDLKEGGEGIIGQLISGIQSKEGELTGQIENIKSLLDSLNEKAKEIAKVAIDSGSEIIGSLINGMDSEMGNLENIVNKASEMLRTFIDNLSKFKDDASTQAKGIMQGVVKGLGEGHAEIKSAFEDINGMFRECLSNLKGIESEFYTAGANIITALQNGINSIRLMIPTISVSFWPQYYNNGQNWVDIPQFEVNYPWAAKGGLFTDPSIIGVGEAGDEAVLPLTNRKTMGMIADAIVSNSSGIGLDEQSLVDAVAQGYVRAMMANQNNQQQPIINVVCKTENDEVLFRAVQRGRESVEYRNNPTAQYGF